MKNSISGVNLLRHLANQGLRIFSTEQAKTAALEIEMNPAYVSEALDDNYLEAAPCQPSAKLQLL